MISKITIFNMINITHTDFNIKLDNNTLVCNGFSNGEATLLLRELDEASTFYGKSVFHIDELGIIAQKILRKLKCDWEYSFIQYTKD